MSFDPIIYALVKKNGGGGGGGSSPADWNAKEGEPGYIKNRTHWVEDKIVLIDNQICDFSSAYGVWFSKQSAGNAFVLTPDCTYDVVWDGVLYAGLLCTSYGDNSFLGAGYLGDETGIPFTITSYKTKDYSDIVTNEGPTHTISVIQWTPVIHHLDHKYIKDMYYEEAVTDDGVIFKDLVVDCTCYRGQYDGYLPVEYGEYFVGGQEYTLTVNGISMSAVAEYGCDNGDEPTADHYDYVWFRSEVDDRKWFELTYAPQPSDIREHAFYLHVTYSDFGEQLTSLTVSLCGPASTTNVIHHLDHKYIKDMYYEEYGDIVLIDNQTIEFTNGSAQHPIETANAEAGQIFTVIWDGVTYENLTCYLDGSYPTVGSSYDELNSGMGDYPFSICPLYYQASLKSSSLATTHTVTLKMKGTIVHTLDEKYIPDTIARLSDVEAMITGAIGGSY